MVIEEIPFYNPQQFEAVLRHYSSRDFLIDQYHNYSPIIDTNIRFHSLLEDKEDLEKTLYHSEYRNLCNEIIYRQTLQENIDNILHQESRYIVFNLEVTDNNIFSLHYINLNESTLSLAIRYFELMMRIFKIGSYHYTQDGLEIDKFMIHILTQCDEKIGGFHLYKPFGTYYTDSLLYTQQELPLTMLRVNLEFKSEKGTRILHIKSIDQFKAIINHYVCFSNEFIPFTPLKLSSEYKKNMYDEIKYRNTLQLRIDRAVNQLSTLKLFFKYEDDLLNLNFYELNSRNSIKLIRYLELIFTTFKIGNDDTNDKDAIKLFLMALKSKCIQKVSDNIDFKIDDEDIDFDPSTLCINLQLVSKTSDYRVSRIIIFEEGEILKEIFNYFNSLPDGYILSKNNKFDLSSDFDNFLFLFIVDCNSKSGNENDPFLFDLYYYSKSNTIDILLFIKYIELIGNLFKKYCNKEDKITMDNYLSSIIDELKSINNTIIKSFGHPHNPTDSTIIIPSSLTLQLRLLPFDNLVFKDTLYFQDTSRFLSILNHYSLVPDEFDPSNTMNVIDSSKINRHKIMNNHLLKLSEDILFYFEKLNDKSIYYLTYSKLKSKDVHSALLHLELMIRIFDNGSNDNQGNRVLNGFVKKARKKFVNGLIEDSLKEDNKKTEIQFDRICKINNFYVPNKKSSIITTSSIPKDVSVADGKLGDVCSNIPNLLEITGNDISMMEEID